MGQFDERKSCILSQLCFSLHQLVANNVCLLLGAEQVDYNQSVRAERP